MTLAFPVPRGRVFALGLVVLAVLMGLPLAAPAVAAGLGDGSVTLTILDVSPSTPAPSQTLQQVQVSFRIRNNTSDALNAVQVSGERDTPITEQKALDDAMANPSKRDTTFVSPIDTGSTSVDVPPGGTTSAIFTTTIGIPTTGGICECANAIYPLVFTARTSDGIVLGSAQTFVPAFKVADPAKLKVGWVWPLLDVPHRLTSDTTFLNDDLAHEVAPGGRLDRALSVLESVAPTVPMTVITDPELIDELEVMAEGNYHVQAAGAVATVGIGTGAAAAWLSGLRTVLTQNPSTELDLTPYGDPDVEAAQRNGLSWTNTQPVAMQARVSAALSGISQVSDIAWPLEETLSKDTLETLVGRGTTTTVILNSATLPDVGLSPTSDALASYSVPGASVTVGITNPSIERWAAKVLVSSPSVGGYFIPELVSQVALHAVSSVDESHFVLITPPRILDVDPTIAARAILDTSTTPWAEPMPLRTAVQTISAAPTRTLETQHTTPLPESTVGTLRYVSQSVSGLNSMFVDDADRLDEIGSLPAASQLALSSSLVPRAQDTVTYSDRLNSVVFALVNGVHLVKPARGNYTLTSTNASLPITISNDLTKAVRVDITAEASGGVPGFSATPIVSRLVQPGNTQLKLPTRFVRPGRIEVQVQLSTPTGLVLGDSIKLSVRSTALGAVGIIITTVAGVVLFVALLIRVVKRVRERNRSNAAAA